MVKHEKSQKDDDDLLDQRWNNQSKLALAPKSHSAWERNPHYLHRQDGKKPSGILNICD